MKILKKAAALFIAAAISLSSAFSAFAQTSDAPQTEIVLDIYKEQYTPIDKTQFVKWKASDKPAENTNYYIDSTVKIAKDKIVSFPQSSTLVLCEGANLQIYADAKVYFYGKMIIEPRARLTVSGMVNFKETSALANYGSFISTNKSTVKIGADFVNHEKGAAVLSGSANVFKNANIINHGSVTFAPASDTIVTGSISNTEKAKLFIKGKLTVTLSGKITMNGLFSLLGEMVNSGTMILQKPVKFYKGADSKLATSKCSRIIDYRSEDAPEQPEEEKPEQKPEEKPEQKPEEQPEQKPTEEPEQKPTEEPTQEPEKEPEDIQKIEIKGIDVSSWQSAINWKKVKNAGIKFAMIRASFSDDKVDKTFEYNIVEAAKVGIDVGVYHYCYALTVEEARAEAKHFIDTISPYKITYPVVLDFEDSSQVKLDQKLKNKIAQVFIEEIRKAGYYPMIYSYSNWFENYMDMEALDCEVWIAHWNVPKPTYKGSYGMWQYSAKGKVSGIDGDVDLNICYKDYAKIIREGGYNNLDKFD